MKNFLLILFLFPLLAFGQKVKGFLGSDEYNVANESYIKFNFQKHSDENTTYKFKFFQDVSGIEFWAHHSVDASIENKYLSILSDDYKVDLAGEEIRKFYNLISKNYKTFLKEVRIKKPNVHMDINLSDDGSFIFSSHMINLKSNFAFWLNEKKYNIDEKDFLKLIAEIRIYFDFEKVDLEE